MTEKEPRQLSLFPSEDEKPDKPKQELLFDPDERWREEWKGMPEYVNEDLYPWKTLKVHFKSAEDLKKFAELIGQKLTETTRSIWYPEAKAYNMMNKRWVDDES